MEWKAFPSCTENLKLWTSPCNYGLSYLTFLTLVLSHRSLLGRSNSPCMLVAERFTAAAKGINNIWCSIHHPSTVLAVHLAPAFIEPGTTSPQLKRSAGKLVCNLPEPDLDNGPSQCRAQSRSEVPTAQSLAWDESQGVMTQTGHGWI